MSIYKKRKTLISSNPDELGDYLKTLEKNSEQKLLYNIPLVVRLDGKSFHTYTKHLKRPYEPWLCNLMQETTKFLIKETNALIGYTQSDEITLIYKHFNHQHEFSDLYGYRKNKIESILAGMASSFFAVNAAKHKSDMIPYFDCRAFNVPREQDACSILIWRQDDAIRNSMSMLAQSVFSHKELLKKNWESKNQMLLEKGIDWNTYPTHFKTGSFWKKQKYEIFPEFSDIPEKYRPTEPVIRTKVLEVEMSNLRNVSNLEKIIFSKDDVEPSLIKE